MIILSSQSFYEPHRIICERLLDCSAALGRFGKAISESWSEECLSEKSLSSRTDLPCCLATLSHWLGAALGNLGKQSSWFRNGWALGELDSRVTSEHTLSLIPSSILCTSHTLFFHTGLGDNFFIIPMGWSFLKDFSEEERKHVADHCPIAAVFRAAANTPSFFPLCTLCLSGLEQMWL